VRQIEMDAQRYQIGASVRLKLTMPSGDQAAHDQLAVAKTGALVL
jgi:hypothetical protein